jgi:hypothetical protein
MLFNATFKLSKTVPRIVDEIINGFSDEERESMVALINAFEDAARRLRELL